MRLNIDKETLKDFMTFPINFIVGTVVATLLGFLYLSGSTQSTHNYLIQLKEDRVALEQLAGELEFSDEALSMSVRLAATTADYRWKSRYDYFDKKMFGVVNNIKALIPPESHAALGIEDWTLANKERARLEKLSFKWIKNGVPHKSKNLIFGESYQGLKDLFSEGTVKALNFLKNRKDKEIGEAEVSWTWLQFNAFAIMILVFGSWCFIVFWIERHLRMERKMQSMVLASAEMATVGKLSGTVAHEINNSVAIIVGRAENLMTLMDSAKYTKDRAKKMADKIRESAHKITDIIGRLRSMSAGNSGDHSIEVVEVKEIIKMSLDLCQHRFQNHDIELSVSEVPAGVYLNCDKSKLSRVFVSMLSNSLEAVDKLEDKWVSLDTLVLKDGIEFIFTDSGKGIPPDVLEKIMSPFFSTKNDSASVGFGLDVAKSIIEEFGGELNYVQNAANTRFKIRLPRHEE